MSSSSTGLQPVIDALRNGGPDAQAEAHRTLVTLTGEDFGTDADPWQAWWDVHRAEFLPGAREERGALPAPIPPETAGTGPSPADAPSSPPAPESGFKPDSTRLAMRGIAPLYHQRYGGRADYEALSRPVDAPRGTSLVVYLIGPVVFLSVLGLILYQLQRTGLLRALDQMGR